MKTTIKEELKQHLLDLVNDGVLTEDNKDEWHFHAFNEDYYIIGYYNASKWLEKHGIGEFEAAAVCTQYEIDNFGELGKVYDNSETCVNMLAYIYGEELLGDQEIIDEIEEKLSELTEA
tara:strand:- start:104 stop:460 length:357 start_codon:yes stop_codon:yes gene_type:complete